MSRTSQLAAYANVVSVMRCWVIDGTRLGEQLDRKSRREDTHAIWDKMNLTCTLLAKDLETGDLRQSKENGCQREKEVCVCLCVCHGLIESRAALCCCLEGSRGTSSQSDAEPAPARLWRAL